MAWWRPMPRRLIGAAVVLALGLLLALVQQKSSLDFVDQHARTLGQLGVLRQADREWTVQILAVQSGLAVNYDVLSRAAEAVSLALGVAMWVVVRFVVAADTPLLAPLHRAIGTKEAAAERMKSERAILANSLRFLPTQVDELAHELRKRRSQPATRQQAQGTLDAVNVVARAVLRSVSHLDVAAVADLDDALVALERTAASHAALRDMATRFELLGVHARAVVRHRQQAHDASVEALEAPVVAAIDALEAQVNRLRDQRLADARRYRGYFLLLGATLCVGALYAAAGWWRSYRELGAANTRLGQQLEETRRLMRRADELQLEATRDPLTGLANRRLVEDRLAHALRLAQRQSTAVSVLFLDLDGFKAVNDRHGHAVGDELLIEVARRLQRQVRDADTVARLGGDEFVLILEGTGESGARRVAGSVIEELRTIAAVGARTVSIAASVGVVVWTPAAHRLEAGALLDHADAAMYEAKRAGKGRYALVSVGRWTERAVSPAATTA